MNPLPLESLSPQKAYLDNAILGRNRETRFTIEGEPWEFQFSPPINDYQPGPFFKIKMSDHSLWLSLNQLPPLSFFSKDLADVSIDALPSDIQPLVLESSWEPLLASIEAFLGVAVTIEEFTATPPEALDEHQLFFTVTSSNTHTPFSGCLHLTLPALELLAVLYERAPTIPSPNFADVEIPSRLVIARDSIPLNQFSNLNVQDILFINANSFLNSGNCEVVFANHLCYKANFKDGNVTLLEAMEEETELNKAIEPEEEESYENPESPEGDAEAPAAAEAAGAPADLDSLPINLVFEVGQKRIPLKELQSLKPGFTFELSNPTHNPVTIRANGRVIGSGQLLQIGERVGVRVSSFTEENA